MFLPLSDVRILSQLQARDGLIPTLGTVRQVASPLRLSGAEPPVRRGPLLGEHTHEVAQELCGHDADRFATLQSPGAFGA